ncbi:hypothetical protein J6590_104821 [Homalodisca vitripennis]|nr:hypothetical protein J6590_104821 [Homalodisca vitripennis]
MYPNSLTQILNTNITVYNILDVLHCLNIVVVRQSPVRVQKLLGCLSIDGSNQELEEQEPDNFGTSDVDEPDSDISSNEDHSDPASYANLKLSPEDINVALNLKNQDLSSIEFPSTGGRKFNPLWKNCILPNNSVKPRKWLVYSKKRTLYFVCLAHYLHFQLNGLYGEQPATEGGQSIEEKEIFYSTRLPKIIYLQRLPEFNGSHKRE